MKDKLQAIREEALKQIRESNRLDKLNEVRVSFLGQKGELTAVLKGMKNVDPKERRDKDKTGRKSTRRKDETGSH